MLWPLPVSLDSPYSSDSQSTCPGRIKMGKREEYTACMKPHMTGGGEDRKIRFCIGAKLCSGKAKNEDEARTICLQPKPVKVKKSRKASGPDACLKEAGQVAECVVKKLTLNEVYKDQAMNINSVGAAIANAIIECQCPQE
jgi:hypothetical protein